jgi:hypothetical protein
MPFARVLTRRKSLLDKGPLTRGSSNGRTPDSGSGYQGSNPCPRTESGGSPRRFCYRPHGLAVRTAPSHGAISGSIPDGVTFQRRGIQGKPWFRVLRLSPVCHCPTSPRPVAFARPQASSPSARSPTTMVSGRPHEGCPHARASPELLARRTGWGQHGSMRTFLAGPIAAIALVAAGCDSGTDCAGLVCGASPPPIEVRLRDSVTGAAIAGATVSIRRHDGAPLAVSCDDAGTCTAQPKDGGVAAGVYVIHAEAPGHVTVDRTVTVEASSGGCCNPGYVGMVVQIELVPNVV